MNQRDYYKVLGVSRSASQDEIKKAYRKLAHQHHPDKNFGGDAKFKEINEAYQVLGDEIKRRRYDQFGESFDERTGPSHSWNDIFRGGGTRADFGDEGEFDFADIFESMFGFGGQGSGRPKTKKGRDLVFDLSIPFEESILGGRETFDTKRTARCGHCNGTGGEPASEFMECAACRGKGVVHKTERTFLGTVSRTQTCGHCLGRGKIPAEKCSVCQGRGLDQKMERIELVIPPGINHEDTLKLSGKGEVADPQGTPGDLYVRIKVMPHRTFRRQGDNLLLRLPVKISQAILGETVTVATLNEDLKLKIPEGTQSGDILRMRGKGVKSSNGYGSGDLLIEIKVEIPRKASKKLKETIERLKEEGL